MEKNKRETGKNETRPPEFEEYEVYVEDNMEMATKVDLLITEDNKNAKNDPKK
jgi:hypothetical protein